jgi:tripartite-type tricarboxylate transporter receptor subunit TctC
MEFKQMTDWRTTRRLLLGAAALPWMRPAVWAAQPPWPVRAVKLQVGYPPGSSPDFVARALAEPLAKALGQPVIVENRPGASGNIAAAAVANATDQHTLGVLINGNMTVARLLNAATPYDPLRDLVPISLVCEAPLLLAVAAGANASAREFLQAARAAGEGWSYGSPGVGTIGHLATEVFKARATIQARHVPYPSYQRIAAALIAGELQMSFVGLGAAMPLVEAGRLVALGVTSAQRSPLAPGVATLAEAGLPALEFLLWTGIAAPRGMPPATVARLSSVLGEIARSPAVRSQLRSHGYDAVGVESGAFTARVRNDYQLLETVIKTQGIRNE